MTFYVYLIENSNRTYIGYTVDPIKRLRQHNSEIKGGARYTSRSDGGWTFACLVTSPHWKTISKAMQIEWESKHPYRRRRPPAGFRNIEGRCRAVALALQGEDDVIAYVRPGLEFPCICSYVGEIDDFFL
jgi:predicted GIY-YIG superfamily endonuclease